MRHTLCKPLAPQEHIQTSLLARRLTGLQRLVLWGSELSDHCMWDLEKLTALTELDLSLSGCSSPPVLGTLRVLSMIHCQLDVVGEDRESAWLDRG